MGKLSMEIRGKLVNLPEGFSVDVEDVNPLFNDYQSFTFDAELPIESNRHIFSDIDHIHSNKRLVDMENERVQLIADGIPFRSGRLQTNEGEVIDQTITVSMINTTQTIKDMVADLTCRDIPVIDKIQIGEMIGNVLVKFSFDYQLEWKSSGKQGFLSWSSTKTKGQKFSESMSHYYELQALGFSYPGICQLKSGSSIEEAASSSSGKPYVDRSFINVSESYPYQKYCNARVCYTHYKKEADGSSGKTVSTNDEYDPYYMLDADRQQSGICFYVLYFLDCLFNYLGMAYDNSNLLFVEDMKRLCFFTTRCKYDLERKYPSKGVVGEEENITYDLNNLNEINRWLYSRKTGGKLELSHEDAKKLDSLVVNGVLYKIEDKLPNGETLKKASYKIKDFESSVQANIMNMYANSENFPDASISSVLDSLWGSFGIRFIADYERMTVRPVFIRDIYRSDEPPIEMHVQLIDIKKISEKITGVRAKYSAESSPTEQASNIKNGVKDYNTDFDYIDYSQVDATRDYLYIIRQNGFSDRTCYIDRRTGNAYRIKVNKDATKVEELKPSIFEVGGYKGVEVGDCSSINNDFVEELVSDFSPLVQNDVNGRWEKAISDGSQGEVTDGNGTNYTIGGANATRKKQILAAYIDEEMYHENTEYQIKNVLGNNYADVYLTEICTTDESYDATSTEDGNSPLQHYDWGMTLSVMRGGGSDSRMETYDYDYDGNGNSKWRMTAGEYSLNSDSMDNWGSDYDYNGTTSGIGDGERFSLKMRAYKEVDGTIQCEEDERDENGNLIRKVRSRGLFDTFLSDHAYFLLNRKKYEITFTCQIADIAHIEWERRYKIGGIIFWWNKLNYTLSEEKGLGTVTAEIYTL